MDISWCTESLPKEMWSNLMELSKNYNLCPKIFPLFSICCQILMSVWQVFIAAGWERGALTLRARTAARERPAAAQAMSWLTTTPAMVNIWTTLNHISSNDGSKCLIYSFFPFLLDIDECVVGTHNCGPEFTCQNTPGSFRCRPRQQCGVGFIQDAVGSCIG